MTSPIRRAAQKRRQKKSSQTNPVATFNFCPSLSEKALTFGELEENQEKPVEKSMEFNFTELQKW